MSLGLVTSAGDGGRTLQAGAGGPTPPAGAQVRELAEVFRSILVAGMAAAVAGLLVGGVGGRIVMRIAALLNPQAVGLLTDNDARIGAITIEGSVALALFGGFFIGLFGTVPWVAVRQWLPERRIHRGAAGAVLAVAVGGPLLVDARSHDFAILQSDLLIVGLFLGIVALFGFALPMAEGFFDRRLRHPGADPTDFALATGGLVLLAGFLTVPPVVAGLFSQRACLCGVAPIFVGVPLMLAGWATVAAWILRIRSGGTVRPSSLVANAGRVGLLATAVLGGSILAIEMTRLPM